MVQSKHHKVFTADLERAMSKRYRVSEYTDLSLGDGLPYCRWVVREGNGTPYWALTTCKRGFNPLTKVKHVDEIKNVYDGCYCPICGRPIKTSGYVFDDDFVKAR